MLTIKASNKKAGTSRAPAKNNNYYTKYYPICQIVSMPNSFIRHRNIPPKQTNRIFHNGDQSIAEEVNKCETI